MLQVDEQYHKIDFTNYPTGNIKQGTKILMGMITGVKKKFPCWSPAQQLQGGIAAYNEGLGNVRTWKNLDVGTTHDDYSNDVVARAKFFRRNGYVKRLIFLSPFASLHVFCFLNLKLLKWNAYTVLWTSYILQYADRSNSAYFWREFKTSTTYWNWSLDSKRINLPRLLREKTLFSGFVTYFWISGVDLFKKFENKIERILVEWTMRRFL